MDNYLYQANTGLTMTDLAAHAEHGADDHDHDTTTTTTTAMMLLLFISINSKMPKLYGVEFELAYQFAPAQQLNIFADSVRAKLKPGADLPRISAIKSRFTISVSGPAMGRQCWGNLTMPDRIK